MTEDARPVLDLQVLGPLRVLHDGRAVELGPARRRTLLAALCVHLGEVVSVDALADLIWDGSPPAKPSATVHALVSRLRGSLRCVSPDGNVLPTVLVTHAPGYRLDLPREALDEHRFTALVERARAEREAGRTEASSGAVREALATWRGAAYADVPAEFARREADRLAEARLGAQELAVQVELDLGRHEALLPEIGRLVEAQPMREGLHAAMMLALYRSGRQAEALHHFGAVRERMADELGVDPGPELRRLHERILRQEPTLDLTSTAVGRPVPAPTAEPASTAGPTTSSAAGPPATGPTVPDEVATGERMVGREAELSRLEAVLVSAEQGHFGAAAVVGEAGIGKTRLVEEAVAAAAARRTRVVWGRCWQHEGAPVLWPWMQALSALVEAAAPEVVAAAVAGRGRAAAALLPQAASVAPTSDLSPIDLATVPLYDAVTHALRVLSEDRPTVVVLEDMHWADQASRELAEYVVANGEGARLAVVLTVRAPTDDATRAGSELLTALARSGRTDRVVLDGLTPDAVRDYVADRIGSPIDRATSEALADRTAGNPFFVGELVRLLVTDERPVEDGTGPGAAASLPDEVPDSIREVITRRLRRLPEDDQRVLQVAAVVGRTFDLELIEAASQLDGEVVDEAVDRATERGVICSDPAGHGRHRFVHALTQQTLLDTTGPARVRRLHGQVAAAIETRDASRMDLSPATVEHLAFHLARSGGSAELLRAVDLSTAAADEAVRFGNTPQAESLLLHALDLTARLEPSVAGQREMSCRLRLWSLYSATGGPGTPGALAQRERAVALVERYGGARDVLAAHQAAHARATFTGDVRVMEGVQREMAAAAEAFDDDLMRAAAHLARAELGGHRGEPRASLAACDAADGYAEALREVPPGVFAIGPSCHIALWRAFAASLCGDEGLVTAAVAQAGQRAQDGMTTTEAYALVNLATIHALRDDAAATLEQATAAADLARRHGFVEAGMYVEVLRVWALERTEPGGHLDELAAAVEATRVMPTLALRPSMLGMVADVQRRAGRLEAAAVSLEAAFDEVGQAGGTVSLAELHRVRAEVAMADGASASVVRADLARAEEVAREQGNELYLRRVLTTRGP